MYQLKWASFLTISLKDVDFRKLCVVSSHIPYSIYSLKMLRIILPIYRLRA